MSTNNTFWVPWSEWCAYPERHKRLLVEQIQAAGQVLGFEMSDGRSPQADYDAYCEEMSIGGQPYDPFVR
jgi:hypothetical protein